MRPIKFRGKRIDNGEWVYGYYSAKKHEGIECGVIFTQDENNEENLSAPQVIPETVGQFTGIFDDQEKEIYEGDIVRAIAPPQFQEENGSFLIMWNIDEACFGLLQEQKENYTLWKCPIEWWRSIIVIGKMSEHPELLTKNLGA